MIFMHMTSTQETGRVQATTGNFLLPSRASQREHTSAKSRKHPERRNVLGNDWRESAGDGRRSNLQWTRIWRARGRRRGWKRGREIENTQRGLNIRVDVLESERDNG